MIRLNENAEQEKKIFFAEVVRRVSLYESSKAAAELFYLFRHLNGYGNALGYLDFAKFGYEGERLAFLLGLYPDSLSPEVNSLLSDALTILKSQAEKRVSSEQPLWETESLCEEIQKLCNEIEKTKEKHESKSVAENAVEVAQHPDPNEKKNVKTKQKDDDAKIKIDSSKVENILNLVGELVVLRSQIQNQVSSYATDIRLNSLASQLDKTVRELHEKTLSMRLTPLKPLFQKIHWVLRDLSQRLKKPVNFVMEGENTEVDRSMVDLLLDPIVHIARNSVDHGIESKEKRKDAKKNLVGTIRLSARQVGDRIFVEISDDGGGIDRGRVIERGKKRGLLSKDLDPTDISDQQVFSLLFEPGFSTAEVVTDISGRGVGLDVVKSNIEKLKGSVVIDSVPGEGTKFSLQIPLSAAITDGMVLKARGIYGIIPLDCIRELIRPEETEVIELENKTSAIRHRDTVYPVLDLGITLSEGRSQAISESENKVALYILLEAGNRRAVASVNQVIGQRQVVLKRLSESFKGVKGISGAAILGDGQVALVINPYGLLNLSSDVQSRQNLDESMAA